MAPTTTPSFATGWGNRGGRLEGTESLAEPWEGLLPVRLLEPEGLEIGKGKLSCRTFWAKGGLNLARMYEIITHPAVSIYHSTGEGARAAGGSYPNNRK